MTRPLLSLIERFFPARIEKTVKITTSGVLKVTVTVNPPKGYTTTSYAIIVDAYDPQGLMELGLLGWTVEIDYGDTTKDTFSPVIMPPWSYSHYYSVTGTFTVTVKVTDKGTGAIGTGTATAQVATTLTTSFTVDKTSGAIPLTVIFTCGASGGFLNYTWSLDPGDGSTPYTGTRTASGTWNQAHTYNKVGSFTAKLTVDDALGASVQAQVSVGAGTVILFPKLREMFPKLFEGLDKLRQKVPERPLLRG